MHVELRGSTASLTDRTSCCLTQSSYYRFTILTTNCRTTQHEAGNARRHFEILFPPSFDSQISYLLHIFGLSSLNQKLRRSLRHARSVRLSAKNVPSSRCNTMPCLLFLKGTLASRVCVLSFVGSRAPLHLVTVQYLPFTQSFGQ
jgi:hypothetical protein